jgi:hypothetical protein
MRCGYGLRLVYGKSHGGFEYPEFGWEHGGFGRVEEFYILISLIFIEVPV